MINRRGRRYDQQEGEEVWSTGGGGMVNRRGRRYGQQEGEEVNKRGWE